MAFTARRIINCPESEQHGKTAWVDLGARGYNPFTDKYDDDWAVLLIGDIPDENELFLIPKEMLEIPSPLEIN